MHATNITINICYFYAISSGSSKMIFITINRNMSHIMYLKQYSLKCQRLQKKSQSFKLTIHPCTLHTFNSQFWPEFLEAQKAQCCILSSQSREGAPWALPLPIATTFYCTQYTPENPDPNQYLPAVGECNRNHLSEWAFQFLIGKLKKLSGHAAL